MKLVYSLAHPSDHFDDERAGHIVRPRQLIGALRAQGHAVEICEAAGTASAQAAASSYWRIRSLLPSPVALAARDAARVAQNQRFGRRLLAQVQAFSPAAILETQVAFSTAGAWASARAGIPLVLDDVSPAEEDETVYDVALTTLARRRRRTSLTAARLIVVTSEAIRAQIEAEGVPAAKLVVIANAVPGAAPGTPADRAAERGRLGIRPDDIAVAYVGSFQPFHRLDLLLDALAMTRLRDTIRVLLIGDGPRRVVFEEAAAARGLADRCVFAGRVQSDLVHRTMSAADAAVLPATEDYTNPMKLYDYLAAGLPIVAPDQQAVRTVVPPEAMRTFTPLDAVGLAAALDEIAGDAALRERLGAAGFESAENQTWTNRAELLASQLGSI
jgi:glycosyltransferase involved in cell wall biosynthesis